VNHKCLDLSDTASAIQDAVGDLDEVDTYRFTTAQTTELRLNLEGLSDDAIVSLIVDANADGAATSDEIIEQVTFSGGFASLSEVIGPGVYFLEVTPDTNPDGQNTAYSLSWDALGRDSLFGIRTFTYEPQFGQLILSPARVWHPNGLTLSIAISSTELLRSTATPTWLERNSSCLSTS
jgi:hypothetical protein